MGPITYALCQKPVIGTFMWITSLCYFPPLFNDVPIALDKAGATASSEFIVPVEKIYPLELSFEFPSVESRLSDKIVGSRYDKYCSGKVNFEEIPEDRRSGLGKPIPFKVTIRRKSDRIVVLDEYFESLCSSSHAANKKWRPIGLLELKTGKYIAEVTNVEAQTGLSGVETSISLVAGRGK